MNTPFTTEQFFEVFENYNKSVYPIQILFYLLGLAVIYFVIRNSASRNKFINIVLAFLWIWMGVVYHFTFFSPINNAAFLFGLFFIVQGALFLILGGLQNKLSYRFKNNLYGRTGLSFVLFALMLYPLVGYLNGHIYPYSPTFGLPCPTTIFTLGILIMSDKKVPIILLVIPVLWSLIGFTAAIKFGVIEDAGLLIAGIVAFILIIKKRKYITQPVVSKING